MDDLRLLIPGPTPLPPEVRQAMARPMINHRGDDFGRMLSEVLDGLRRIFQTAGTVLPFAASGTGGLEAAVANTLSPGDPVLAVVGGAFGERFAAVARGFGAEVIPLEVEWGRAADADDVRRALGAHPEVRAVLVTHNETSTGVTHPLRDLAGAVREGSDALLLVDAVSSLGALDLQTDAWGLDVVVAGSQKALMGPPGAVFLAVSDRAWEASRAARMPRWYFSWERARAEIAPGRALTPFTPPLPVIYALAVSVPMILAEGLPARFERHRRLGRATRDGVAALGLRLLADLRHASDTVTAVRVPEGVDGRHLVRRLRERGVEVAGGQGRLEGRIIRIGHMGAVQAADIAAALAALEQVLPEVGHPVRPGTVAAAGLDGP